MPAEHPIPPTPPTTEPPLSEADLLVVAAQEDVIDVTENLNPKRRAFVREFLKDSNGTRAALRAGYSSKTAGQIANLLLKEPAVAAAIKQGQEQLEERINITQAKVLSEMTALATSNIEHYVIDDEGNVKLAPGAPENAMSAIQSIERDCIVRTILGKDDSGEIIKTYKVKIKLWDKPTPLKLIGKHVSLFADRVEHTGKDGGPIETVTKVERLIVDPKQEETHV